MLRRADNLGKTGGKVGSKSIGSSESIWDIELCFVSCEINPLHMVLLPSNESLSIKPYLESITKILLSSLQPPLIYNGYITQTFVSLSMGDFSLYGSGAIELVLVWCSRW